MYIPNKLPLKEPFTVPPHLTLPSKVDGCAERWTALKGQQLLLKPYEEDFLHLGQGQNSPKSGYI